MRLDYSFLPNAEDDFNVYVVYDKACGQFLQTYNQKIVVADRINLSKLVNLAYRRIGIEDIEICSITPNRSNIYVPILHKPTNTTFSRQSLIILPDDTDGT